MSSVDTRVVQMQFDNKQFESGVSTTMKTLEKFKESLNFEGLERGFEALGDACEAITNKFSAFGTITDQILRNVANKITSMGHQLMGTINQMGAGMHKYESLMGATRTIMNATGKSVDEINEVMLELNKYTDETSYNFSDLVGSMSTILSSGAIKDMGTAEKVMEGMANAAAHAGIGIQQAAWPMQTFTKAMSAGKMTLNQWDSLNLAHFITPQMINTMIEAGKAVGTLDKEGNLIKNGKKIKITAQNIRETLHEGWMTADVMSKAFEVYADRESELGEKAFNAAREAKTFTDVIEALKDAISTGWMKSFQLLFGNVEQAAKFFTWMAEAVIGVSDSISSFRNQLLKEWNEAGGRNALVDTIVYIWETISELGGQITTAFTNIFGVLSSEDLINFTNDVHDAVQKLYMWLGGDANKGLGPIAPRFVLIRQAFEGVASVGRVLLEVIKGVGSVIGSFFGELIDADDILLKLGETGRNITAWANDLINNGKISGFFEKIKTDIAPLAKSLQSLGKAIWTFFGNVKKGIEESDAWASVSEWFAGFKKDIGDGFPDVIQKIANFLDGITAFLTSDDIPGKITEFANNLWEGIRNLFGLNKKDEEATSESAEKEAEKKVEATGSFFDTLKDILPKIAGIAIPAGLAIGAIVIVAKLFGFVGKLVKGVVKPFTSISEFVENVKDTVEKFSKEKLKEKKLKNIKTLATAILMIAGSIWLIGSIGWEKALIGLGGVVAVFGVMFLISSLASRFKAIPTKAVTSLIGMSFAIVVLASVVRMLSGISWKGLAVGLVGLAGIFLEIVAFMALMNIAGVKSAPKKMIGFSVAIAILALSVKSMSSLNFNQVVNGLIALGGVLLYLAVFLGILKVIGVESAPTKMIGLAVSILIISSALKSLSSLSINQIVNGLAGLGGILLELAGFMALIKVIGGTQAPKGLLRIAVSVGLLALSLKLLAGIPVNQLVYASSALMAIEVQLLAFIGAIKLIGAKDAPKGLIKIAIAVGILVISLKTLASMDWSSLAKALIGLGGIFLELYFFVKAMWKLKSVNSDSLNSIGIIAFGIGGLVGALSTLGKLSFGGIVKGLIGLAGIMTILYFFMSKVNGMFGSGSVADGGKKTFSGMIKFSLGMVILSAAIRIMVESVMPLANLSVKQLVKGVGGLAVLMLALSVLMSKMNGMFEANTIQNKLTGGGKKNSFSGIIAFAVGMVTLITALAIMANSAVELGKLDTEQIIRGVASITILSLVLSKLMNSLAKTQSHGSIKNSFASLIVMAGMSILLLSLMSATYFVKDVPVENIVALLAGMWIIVGSISSILDKAKDCKIDGMKMASLIVIFAGVATLVMVVALALNLIKGISWKSVLAFTVGLALIIVSIGAVIGIAGKSNLSWSTIGGIAIIMVAVAALAVATAFAISLIPTGTSWEMVAAFFVGLTAMLLAISLVVLASTLSRFTALAGVAVLMIGVAALAVATAFAISLIPTNTSWESIAAFFAGLVVMLLAISVVVLASTLSRFTALAGVAVLMLGVAALAIAAAYALGMVPTDLPMMTIIAFFAGLTLLLVAVAIVSAIATVIPFTAMLKVVAIIAILAVVIIAITALAALVGDAIASSLSSMMSTFSEGLFNLGSGLEDFNGMVSEIDEEKIRSVLELVGEIITSMNGMLEVDYDKVNSFRTGVFTLGVALKGFNTRLSEIDRTVVQDKLKIIDDIKAAAESLNSVPNVEDMATTVGNIGGAIKLYYDSLNGVDIVPKDSEGNPITADQLDSEGFVKMFQAIAGQMPSEDDLKQVGLYSDKSDGSSLTLFSIGIENLATALTSFSTQMDTVNQESIQAGINNLGQFAAIQQALPITEFEAFDGFFRGKKATLEGLGSDIEAVGEALGSFGDNMTKSLKVIDEETGKTNIDAGIEAAQKMADLGNALPTKQNALFAWFTGKQMSLGEFGSNMSTLGKGVHNFVTEAFADSITYDRNQISAVADCVSTFVDIQNKIENKEHGNAISNFAGFLAAAGTGIRDFNKNLMTENGGTVEYDVEKLKAISEIVDIFVEIQNKIENKESGNAINNFAHWLNEAKGDFKSFFESASKWSVNTESLKAMGEMASGIAQAFGKGFGDGASEAIEGYSSEKITGTIASIVKDISDDFGPEGTFYAEMVACGHYIDLGLEKGIKDYSYKPVNALGNVGSAMDKRIRNVVMVRSPSKLMEEIGMYMDIGLEQGIEGYSNKPVMSIADMARLMLDTERDILGIHSPGEEGKKDGEMHAQGFNIGLTSSWQDVLAQTRNNMENLKDTFVEGYHNITGFFSGEKTLGDVLTDTFGIDTEKAAGALEMLSSGDYAGAIAELTGLGMSMDDISALFGIDASQFMAGTSLEDMFKSNFGLGHDTTVIEADNVDVSKVDTLGGSSGDSTINGKSSTGRGGGSSQTSNLGKQTTTVSSGGLNLSMTDGYTIGDILNRIDRLETAITNMRIVMDSGVLAGQVASGVDKELGNYATLNGRWN